MFTCCSSRSVVDVLQKYGKTSFPVLRAEKEHTFATRLVFSRPLRIACVGVLAWLAGALHTHAAQQRPAWDKWDSTLDSPEKKREKRTAQLARPKKKVPRQDKGPASLSAHLLDSYILTPARRLYRWTCKEAGRGLSRLQHRYQKSMFAALPAYVYGVGLVLLLCLLMPWAKRQSGKTEETVHKPLYYGFALLWGRPCKGMDQVMGTNIPTSNTVTILAVPLPKKFYEGTLPQNELEKWVKDMRDAGFKDPNIEEVFRSKMAGINKDVLDDDDREYYIDALKKTLQ